MRNSILLLTVLCCCCRCALAQDVSDAPVELAGKGYADISSKSLSFIQSKYAKLTASLQKQSDKMLQRMQSKEAKLKSQIGKKDCALSKELFTDAQGKYSELQAKLNGTGDTSLLHPLQEYLPGLDSIQTSLSFLKGANNLTNLSPGKLKQIAAASSEVKALEAKMQSANDVQAFIRERQQQLKERLKGQLLNSSIAKQLGGMNKETFYYEQRLREYKDLINDKKKLEQKALDAVRNLPLFQKFWQKNSYLAQLFPTPQNYGTPQALAGLQTRAGVQQQLQQRFGISNFTPDAAAGTGGTGANYLQQQMQSAQTQLSGLKDKLSNLGINGGTSDMTMPDFKPNSQHTKSFLKRIEYGLNVQSQKSSYGIPVTSDIALTAGYKINDKSAIGIGAAYKLGWGDGLKHIKISSEGVGLRSYVDIKAKGSIWISGGYEMNYMQSFQKYAQLKDLNAWQRSGLIGLTKKYKVGKHDNNMQLLWDFLSYQQVPRTPALKFRVGFTL